MRRETEEEPAKRTERRGQGEGSSELVGGGGRAKPVTFGLPAL